MAKLKVVPKDDVDDDDTPVVVKKRGKKVVADTKKERGVVGKYKGETTGMGVTEFQNMLMEKNFKAKLTDQQLAAAMRREFPSAVDYDEDHVVGIRGAWNKGKHNNIQPSRPLPEFDDTGKPMPIWGEKSAARQQAEAEVHEAKQSKLKRKAAQKSA